MIIGALLLQSCGSSSKMLFKNLDKIETKGLPYYQNYNKDKYQQIGESYKISVGNILTVSFLSNQDLYKGQQLGGNQSQRITYRVDEKGRINLPLIGKVKISGLTLTQAQDKLEEEFKVAIKNPIISLSVINRRASVIGAVTAPGVYELTNDQTSLIQILASAGGFSAGSRKDRVYIIRGNKQNPDILLLDLTNTASLSAPNTLILDDDIIYVQQRGISRFGDQVQPYVRISQIITGLTGITFLVIQLTRNP